MLWSNLIVGLPLVLLGELLCVSLLLLEQIPSASHLDPDRVSAHSKDSQQQASEAEGADAEQDGVGGQHDLPHERRGCGCNVGQRHHGRWDGWNSARTLQNRIWNVFNSPSRTREGIQTMMSNLPRSTAFPRITLKYERTLTTTRTVGLAQMVNAILAGELRAPAASSMTSHSQIPEAARSTKAVAWLAFSGINRNLSRRMLPVLT